jgi:hypothetical protein
MRDALTRQGTCVADHGPREHIQNFENWTLAHPHHRVFMSEGLGFNEDSPPTSIHKNFVMFRDPQSHVLSQYFHCTESRGTKKKRKRRNRMPKLLYEWLEIWEATRQTKSLAQRKLPHNAHRRWTDPRMRCYNPIDLQSWISGYPQSKPELESKFEAIGILSEFYLSSCVFSTMVLNRVPAACNCSQNSIQPSHGTTTGQRNGNATNQTWSTARTGTVTSTNGSHDDDDDDNNIDNNKNDGTQKTHRGQSHGVKHHGDSYQPTDAEMQLIRNLTMHDQILYDHAKELFHAKVAALERQYDVTFCSSAPLPPAKHPRQQRQKRPRGCDPTALS